MTWPTVSVATTDLDSGTDNAGDARSAIKQAVDNVNDIMNCRGAASGIPELDASSLIPIAQIPTITPAKGGTGQSAYAVGDILYADSASTLAKLSPGTSGKSLVTKGVGNAPAWEVSGGLPSGTRLAFNQTTAPTGWTKDTTAILDDSLLRIVTGTVSSGGTNDFDDVVNAQTVTASHTLTTAQIPAHTHGDTYGSGSSGQIATGKGNNAALGNTSSAGSGGSHSHGITMDIKYNDFIIAERD